MKTTKVIIEVINTSKEFKWRLRFNDEVSDWSGHYAGLLVHKFKNGETWAYATDYWLGTLPTETPFQIIVPSKQ